MVSTATAPLDGAVYAFLQKYFNEGQQRANGAAQAVVERPREDSKRRPAYRPLRPVWLSVCRASRRSAIRAANLLFAPSAAVSRAARLAVVRLMVLVAEARVLGRSRYVARKTAGVEKAAVGWHRYPGVLRPPGVVGLHDQPQREVRAVWRAGQRGRCASVPSLPPHST